MSVFLVDALCPSQQCFGCVRKFSFVEKYISNEVKNSTLLSVLLTALTTLHCWRDSNPKLLGHEVITTN